MLIGILIAIVIIVIAGFAFVVYSLNQRLSELKNDTGMGMLKQDLQGMQEMMERTQAHMTDRLDKSAEQMRDSIYKQFSESSKLITDVTNRLTKLDETNKRVGDVADDLKLLQNVLQNPKQRGVVGEYYLESVMENVLPPGQYQMQYKFTDGEIVDAVIFLEKGKVLPVDSKFSLENYNRLVEETDPTRRDALVRAFKADLKNRIDETSKYIRPAENTMDFAFMFIPSEAIYYDLLVNKVGTIQTNARDLIQYAFSEKNVIIVSPTTMLAYLQTIMQGLRSLQIEDQAKEIKVRVGQLGQHIGAFESYMQKLGNALGVSVGHFNSAHKELKKIDKDVTKIADSSPGVEPLLIDKPSSDQ